MIPGPSRQLHLNLGCLRVSIELVLTPRVKQEKINEYRGKGGKKIIITVPDPSCQGQTLSQRLYLAPSQEWRTGTLPVALHSTALFFRRLASSMGMTFVLCVCYPVVPWAGKAISVDLLLKDVHAAFPFNFLHCFVASWIYSSWEHMSC